MGMRTAISSYMGTATEWITMITVGTNNIAAATEWIIRIVMGESIQTTTGMHEAQIILLYHSTIFPPSLQNTGPSQVSYVLHVGFFCRMSQLVLDRPGYSQI